MGLPRKLKNFNLFNAGHSYIGMVTEIALPKVTRKMEEYRASGMNGPVHVDFGNEAIVLEWTAAGLIEQAIKQYGARSHSAVQLRFSGAYQNDDDGNYASVDIVIRGRHKEIDMGSAKSGEDTLVKFTTVCSYYKLMIDNEVLMELDYIAGIENIGGVDLNEPVRKAIGL